MLYDGPPGLMLDLVPESESGVDIEWNHPYTKAKPYLNSSQAYMYGFNNPVKHVDPSGLGVVDDILDVVDDILNAVKFNYGTRETWSFCVPFPYIPGSCVCIVGSVSYDVVSCCKPPQVVCGILQVQFDVGLYQCSSVGLGFQKGLFKNWKNPKVSRLPGSGLPIVNVPIRHGLTGCPPEGDSGQICVTGSVGLRSWTVGARGCVHFPGGQFVGQAGIGVGYGTGISGGGGYTNVHCG